MLGQATVVLMVVIIIELAKFSAEFEISRVRLLQVWEPPDLIMQQ